MDSGEYRRDYAAYRSALERARFSHHAGLVPQPDLKPFEERYADLWTQESIDELHRAHTETPEQFETERAALRALAGAARLKYVDAHASEVCEELKRCADSARFDWQGRKLAAGDAPELIAAEGVASRRRELAARWLEVVRGCDDLRAARLELLDDAARALGFDGKLALHESVARVSLEKLAAAAELFLERTERVYMSRLSHWATRWTPSSMPGALHYADGLFFRRAAHLDAHFKGRSFRAVYAETLVGLGIRLETQGNLQLDDHARPSKNPRPACFAIAPPEDVRLVVGATQGGAVWQRSGFHEGARAQAFASASRDLAARYPEFVHAPDDATNEGHAALFSGLFGDAVWLGEHRERRASEAHEAAGRLALVELHDARRACASLSHTLALASARGARSEQLAGTYAARHTEATGFRYEAATHLLDAGEDFAAPTWLRARLFAAGLAEHLRGRHGRRWYASRAAGDELRDLWNTASRYSVEELARLVWGGELSFELLAEELIAAVNSGDE
ncbi:MAG: hypothetical protein H0T60_10200 [Acidobacteria bacterium]|nr:hypothetical protein [Acidobacteriota bacterium]